MVKCGLDESSGFMHLPLAHQLNPKCRLLDGCHCPHAELGWGGGEKSHIGLSLAGAESLTLWARKPWDGQEKFQQTLGLLPREIG